MDSCCAVQTAMRGVNLSLAVPSGPLRHGLSSVAGAFAPRDSGLGFLSGFFSGPGMYIVKVIHPYMIEASVVVAACHPSSLLVAAAQVAPLMNSETFAAFFCLAARAPLPILCGASGAVRSGMR